MRPVLLLQPVRRPDPEPAPVAEEKGGPGGVTGAANSAIYAGLVRPWLDSHVSVHPSSILWNM